MWNIINLHWIICFQHFWPMVALLTTNNVLNVCFCGLPNLEWLDLWQSGPLKHISRKFQFSWSKLPRDYTSLKLHVAPMAKKLWGRGPKSPAQEFCYIKFFETVKWVNFCIGVLSPLYTYTKWKFILRRKLSCRKDDRAMRPIYGCPENVREFLECAHGYTGCNNNNK